MKILLSCFEPFGEDETNASCEAVAALPDSIGGAEIIKVRVPTVFGKSADCLRKAIEAHNPDAVICVGQASGRFGITPERVAINLIDARIPDNEGAQPKDIPIVAEGPAAYFSTLPVKRMVAAMQQEGIPASVSNTAGTYVCNQLMYALMHFIHTEHLSIMGGFVHVPYTATQAAKTNKPSMAVSLITQGLTICIETILTT